MVMIILRLLHMIMFLVVLITGKKLRTGFKGSNRRFTRRYETIQLPMQPQLSESTAVSWGGDTLNADSSSRCTNSTRCN